MRNILYVHLSKKDLTVASMINTVTYHSPVPVQFDWDKIRTEMKPIKMAKTKA